METIWDTAGTEKKKRHFSNGWFFLWSSPLDFVWGRCRRLSGLMQEALGSDAGGVGGSGGRVQLCYVIRMGFCLTSRMSEDRTG